MKEPLEYLVPDYYPDFSCKMGDCRTPCCEGWPVSVTMKDYFHLVGMECSQELRRRLDVSLHLSPHPTEERYAQITPRYDGRCPLHMPDGRCALQAEKGEGVLAMVCRLYPRGVRNGADKECSCANSCEKVVEMLMDRPAPLRFISRKLSFDLPEEPTRRIFFETMGREQEIRLWLIRLMQDRRYPLPQRIIILGIALQAMDDALTGCDAACVERLIRGEELYPQPELPCADKQQLRFGLDAAEKLLAIIDESSHSVGRFGEAVLADFGQGEAAYQQYQTARERFEALLPQWEHWFEHLLVNHMFFTRFPFQDRPVSLRDEFTALCAVYVLLRFLCVGWSLHHPARADLADVAAALFRLVDHTEFDRYAVPVLHRLGCDDWDHLAQLMCQL